VLLGDAAPHVEDDASRGASGEDVGDRPLTESSVRMLARIPEAELRSLLEGYGYAPRFVEGDDPAVVHRIMAEALDRALDDIAAIQRRARAGRGVEGPAGR
jgi:phosphoketolase